MAHYHDKDVRRSFGDKLDNMTGRRGEHPTDRAARIAGAKPSASAQGDAASAPSQEARAHDRATQIPTPGMVSTRMLTMAYRQTLFPRVAGSERAGRTVRADGRTRR